MKLLFDENLAGKLAGQLSDVFPGSIECRQLPTMISDRALWDYAGANGFTIITKDSDFAQLSYLHGPPPKVIWLRCGNRSTLWIERFVRENMEQITSFLSEAQSGMLSLP